MLGLFAQPMLDTRVKPLFTPANVPLTIFVLAATFFAVTLVIWSNTQQQIRSVADHTRILAKYVGQNVRILSEAAGYKAVGTRIQEAQTEILKLVYYEVDSKDGTPVYDVSLLQSPDRKATYEQEREKLRREKAKDTFKYVEIVQIPYGGHLESIFPHDPIYKVSCEFLSDLGRIQPEFASLRTSRRATLFSVTKIRQFLIKSVGEIGLLGTSVEYRLVVECAVAEPLYVGRVQETDIRGNCL